MIHLFHGEATNIKRAMFTPWVPALWLLALAWAIFANIPLSQAGPLAALLVLLTAVDLRTMMLPNALNLSLAVLGLMVAGFSTQSLLGVVVGYAVFQGIAMGSKTLLKTDGLGQGDVKLFAALGAWVGPLGLPLVALVACMAAVVFMIISQTDKGVKFPFGPFLALGGWVVYLHQPWLWSMLARITGHAPPL